MSARRPLVFVSALISPSRMFRFTLPEGAVGYSLRLPFSAALAFLSARFSFRFFAGAVLPELFCGDFSAMMASYLRLVRPMP